jgi:NADH dehydrogenase (ubiquinone) 1 alpha subcomplex subunit 12
MSLVQVARSFLADVRTLGLKETAYRVWKLKDAWVERGERSRLVGKDSEGNSYYEADTINQLRERFVVPADPNKYDASAIPPEWHKWLHRMTDVLPTADMEPKFRKPHRQNPTGSGNIYMQPAHFLNPKYSTVRQPFQIWNPNVKSGMPTDKSDSGNP